MRSIWWTIQLQVFRYVLHFISDSALYVDLTEKIPGAEVEEEKAEIPAGDDNYETT